ncbi:DUF4407 domain-containing protein [Rufibacter quisquiliarum]|uniref:DUF4407 domain-containing protein n=1 Tax=Rufibacter quisquiliarum TaxID=1549639 RepID=A0A839GQ92_9BACT|nr:DUF4407 domain-containing protein [Rufibacter quisquiliarum]MBA9077685.1 hypothetical protein [Rufibacter quisquiliarum]
MRNFFWWCAGADDHILAQCPKSEHVKFGSIGATVLFTGVLAALSGGYALYTVFDSIPAAVAFGLLWGMVIFNLDRFIVSTIRKEGRFGKEFLQILPRLVLALVLAIVISKPLELRIFQKEIDSVLEEKKAQLALEHQQLVNKQFTETDSVRKDMDRIKVEIAAKSAQRDTLYAQMSAESDGTGGTKKIGRGPIFQEKKAQYDKIDAELKVLQEQNSQLIAERQKRIDTLTAQRDKTIAQAKARFDDYGGLMARMEALDKLPWLPSFFIMLLFICLETAPIFTKLISKRGPYDDLLRDVETTTELESLEKLETRRREYDTRKAIDEAGKDARLEHYSYNRRETVKTDADVDLELARTNAHARLKTGKEKIRRETDAYMDNF